VDFFLAPWEAPDVYESMEFWSREHCRLSFEPLRALAVNELYSVDVSPAGCLAPASKVVELATTSTPAPGALAATATYVIERAAVLHGFAGWFDSSLSPGVRLATSPWDPPTCWKQAFFPVPDAAAVRAGDTVELALTARRCGDTLLWQWAGTVAGPVGPTTSFSGHTFLGLAPPVGALDLLRQGCLPPLSSRGVVLAETLAALDGKSTPRQIAERLLDRHPDRFADAEASLAYVVSVATAWGQ
jgi:hypothetical protein